MNDFSRQNAAQGHQRNVDAGHRALQNHQANRSGGGGGGSAIGGLLAAGFLILVVLVVLGVLG